MGKRIFLFLATNFAIFLMLSIVLQILGVTGYVRAGRIDPTALMVMSLIYGMGGAFLSLQISRWIAKRSMGVQLVDGQTGSPDLDWLYRTIQRQAQQAQIPMPEVGVYESPEVNAFATGPSKSRSLVAVSTGLLHTMRRDEVEGVLAHELTHIQNGDMVTMTLIQGVVNAFVFFLSRLIGSMVRDSRGNAGALSFVVTLVLQFVLGLFGMMIVAWFSRAREFRADAGAAAIAGRGNMIAALRRLQGTQELIDTRQEQLATLKITGVRMNMLMASHPPLEDRIAALERMRT